MFRQLIIANIPAKRASDPISSVGREVRFLRRVRAVCDRRNTARVLGTRGTKSDPSPVGMCDHA